MARPDPAVLAEAMNRLWAQFLPQIEERVSILEKAAATLAAGSLSRELCGEASSAAHKLAGILGTFGLEQGTLLARDAEALYASPASAAEAGNERLASLAAQLRSILSAREK
jgi:HPt (histidine-containing phosphotransfer) domain-containing protein